MNFSHLAWNSVRPWFDAIITHPFVVSLADGTLPEEVFARYLLDDAHYLVGFGRALATLSTKAPTSEGGAMLARAAAQAVDAERLLHRDFLIPRGMDPEDPGAAEASPTCRAYIGTLLVDAAFSPVEIGMAGVLPCFRIYAEVGQAILSSQPPPDHPYREWITTYADPDFDQAVKAAETYTDELAHDASRTRLAVMLDAYERAARFEWMFWDAAWRGERWPQPSPDGGR
jgi:thiaminase/transcriptional activator TenA